ncbi:MAG: STAS domain-containing protein [Actinobacteria bacterium]|nr:STAS domain-containing protein [Actinomycetota bacterium]
MLMDLHTTTLEDVPFLHVRGEIDHGTCASLQTVLDELFDKGHTVVLLDLQEVSYIDSGGLSVLLGGVRGLRDRGWLGVIGPNANVRRLLEIVGLLVDRSFRVFEDQKVAEAALSQRTPA